MKGERGAGLGHFKLLVYYVIVSRKATAARFALLFFLCFILPLKITLNFYRFPSPSSLN